VDSPNLLRTEKLQARLVELRQQFDFILMDVPALNQYADAAAVAKLCDGIIMVLEANSTRREAARKMAGKPATDKDADSRGSFEQEDFPGAGKSVPQALKPAGRFLASG